MAGSIRSGHLAVAMLAAVTLNAVRGQQLGGTRPSLAVQQEQYPPTPFEYSYRSEDPEGSHSAQSSGDGNGRITGSYSITLADGRERTVTYVADENGYRAEVTTNELGTESKNPADVVITSSAPTGLEAALQFGPPREVTQQQGIGASRAAATAGGSRAGQQRTLGLSGGVSVPTYGTFAGVQKS